MIVSHEVPKDLLLASEEFNDYHYCLPHLLDQDEEYKEFFLDAKKRGRYIIMDNSLHELGEAYDDKRLLYWIEKIEPDEFIVPDVWMEGHMTAAQAKYWKQFEYPEATKITAVIQGKDSQDAFLCASLLENLGYEKLCISYGATWYNDYFPHVNKDLGKALGRMKFVTTLLEERSNNKYMRYHLLGCSVPQEFGWYRGYHQIESLDTSNPIMAAIDGTLYHESGLVSKPKANMNNHFDTKFKDIDYNVILHNTTLFREINGLKPHNLINTGANLNSINNE
tara:strand:- start:40 stop:879 length:840 start_codon:yes stop_codon:yes gene_type:complete